LYQPSGWSTGDLEQITSFFAPRVMEQPTGATVHSQTRAVIWQAVKTKDLAMRPFNAFAAASSIKARRLLDATLSWNFQTAVHLPARPIAA